MLVVLAPELLELILSYLEPQHLTSFGQTCARARDFIRPNNQILWKASFLQVWDHPKHVWSLLTPSARAVNRDRESSWDWYREVYRRCKAFNVLCRCNSGVRPANVEDIVPPLLDVLDTASYSDIAEDGSRASLNLEFLHRLLQRCPEFDRVVHDYHKDIESISLPLELLTDSDRPITRSMLARRVTVPEWASRFHVSRHAKYVHTMSRPLISCTDILWYNTERGRLGSVQSRRKGSGVRLVSHGAERRLWAVSEGWIRYSPLADSRGDRLLDASHLRYHPESISSLSLWVPGQCPFPATAKSCCGRLGRYHRDVDGDVRVS